MSLDQFLTPAYPTEIQQLAKDLENIVTMYQLGNLSQVEYNELIDDMTDAEKILRNVNNIELKKAMLDMVLMIVKVVKGVVPL